ncbi:hypothetical protein D9613_009035 [Agrocybe pediades]|uniref:Uncharacterized protein n=1 Tax=Agrocybe pediades TaxID=84607 RepID=A0A8H4R507_9AGAR|nr:hypothetical protein D9613_009035 [Agrocybe pediades]
MEDMGDFLCNVVFPPTCNVRFDTRDTITSNQDSWPSMDRVLEGIKGYLQNRSTMWEVPFGREDVDVKASTLAGLLDKTVICAIESFIVMDSEWVERLTIDFHGPSQIGHPTARESYFSFELELNHYDCELNKSASPIKDFFVMMTEATAHWTVGSKIGLELTVEEYREEDVTRFCKSLAPNVWSLVIVPPPYYRGNDSLTLNPELFLYREKMIFDDLEQYFVMALDVRHLQEDKSLQDHWKGKMVRYLNWLQSQQGEKGGQPLVTEKSLKYDIVVCDDDWGLSHIYGLYA